MSKVDEEAWEIIKRFFGLKEKELKLYKFVVERGKALVRDIQNEMKMSKRTIQEYLKELYEKGLLVRKRLKKGFRSYLYFPKDPREVLEEIQNTIKKILQQEKVKKKD